MADRPTPLALVRALLDVTEAARQRRILDLEVAAARGTDVEEAVAVSYGVRAFAIDDDLDHALERTRVALADYISGDLGALLASCLEPFTVAPAGPRA